MNETSKITPFYKLSKVFTSLPRNLGVNILQKKIRIFQFSGFISVKPANILVTSLSLGQYIRWYAKKFLFYFMALWWIIFLWKVEKDQHFFHVLSVKACKGLDLWKSLSHWTLTNLWITSKVKEIITIFFGKSGSKLMKIDFFYFCFVNLNCFLNSLNDLKWSGFDQCHQQNIQRIAHFWIHMNVI